MRGEAQEPPREEIEITPEMEEGLKKGEKFVSASTFLMTKGKENAGVRDGYFPATTPRRSAPENFSNYHKMIRVFSYANRWAADHYAWVKMGKAPRERESIEHHFPEELKLAEDEVLRQVQRDSLAKTIWEVKNNAVSYTHLTLPTIYSV